VTAASAALNLEHDVLPAWVFLVFQALVGFVNLNPDLAAVGDSALDLDGDRWRR
jgi:hypothetical protein